MADRDSYAENPYLCPFLDCERGQRGNDFPSRWEVISHMSRVHDFQGSGNTT